MRQSITQSLKAGFVVLVVAAVGTTGVAIAQTTDEADPAAVTEDGDRHGHRGMRGHFHGERGFGGVINETAEATGLAVRDIIDQLGDGASIADIATANGSSGDAVVAAVLENMSDRLDEAVADERMTAEEAAEKLAEAEVRLNELVATPDPIGARLAERQERMEDRIVERAEQQQALLDLLGLTEDELRAAVTDGQTLAEIAGAQGVAVADLVDLMVTPLAERLDEAVANGDLTQDEADEKLAEAVERTTERVENGAPFGRGGRGGPGRGGPRGGFGPGGPGGAGPGGFEGTQTGVTISA